MPASYPKDQLEFEKWFANEDACLGFLEKLRWPDGFTCSRCSGHEYRRKTRGRIVCKDCSYEGSVFAGTIYQGTHKGLMIWFRAAWWLVNQKYGANALGLKRNLGIGSYETAWAILHKLRLSMVRPGRDRLNGNIEVDEIFVGGANNKQLVGVAAQIDGTRTGRIRLEKIEDRSGPVLQAFVQRHIEPGSTIVTDGLKSYCGVESLGYQHKPMKKPYSWENKGKDADELLPRVHKAASLLKRWIIGTYQGRIETKYLNAYLNEYVFRFNRRTSKSRGLLFHRLIENSVQMAPVTFADLTSSKNHPS